MNPAEDDFMNRIEWEESDEDEDGTVSMTLVVLSDDPVQLARVRRAFRYVVDDTIPELRSVSPMKPDKEK